jgi:CheY-like chemotaxis protein
MAAGVGGGGIYPFEELSQAVAAEPLRAPHSAGFPPAPATNGSLDDEALSKLLGAMEEPATGAPLVREICEDLRGLLEILETPKPAEVPVGPVSPERPGPVAVPRDSTIREFWSRRSEELYPALAGKSIGLAGFPSGELLQARTVFQRQRCQCVDAGNDMDSLSAEAASCDLLVMAAPSVWDLLEPLRPELLIHTAKPILITGQPRLLSRLAQIAQAGPREYVAFPWREEELAWRAAMLLGRPAAAPKTADALPRREKPEILIADEDVTTRTLLASMLQRHGMLCHLAENGTEAIDLLQTRRPCAAILDIVMPGMDGFQVLAAAKQDPNLTRTPVMLLTARCSEVDKLQAFALGADDYLTKPFSPMELAVRLKRLLKRQA